MPNSKAVPAVSFIFAALLWILYFVLNLTGAWKVAAAWPGLVLCAVAGGLIVFAGTRCVKLRGPRVGHAVRTGVLLVFALLTFWKIGVVPAAVLLVGAVAAGALACSGGGQASED